MPALAEALARCAAAHSLEDCRACLESALKSGLLDEDRHFQLWEESRLPSETWRKWHDDLIKNPLSSISDLIKLLGKHIVPGRGDPVALGLPIQAAHRPSVVARAAKYKSLHDMVTLGPVAPDEDVDMLGDPSPSEMFGYMIRHWPYPPLWIGWRIGASVPDFLAEMGTISTAEEASQRFALAWQPLEAAPVAAYLFVFELPTTARPLIPTLADAAVPAISYWHPYFLPAPVGSPTGVLRDLAFPSAATQKAAGHPQCLAEAVMAPIGGVGPLNPLLPIPLRGTNVVL